LCYTVLRINIHISEVHFSFTWKNICNIIIYCSRKRNITLYVT